MAGKSKSFTIESRNNVASILTALPEKPKAERALAAKDIVASLKAEIKAAQAKGYTIEEIVQSFKQGGVDIGLTTLKTALKQPKKKMLISGVVETTKNQTISESAKTSRRVVTAEDKQSLRTEAENMLTPGARSRGDR